MPGEVRVEGSGASGGITVQGCGRMGKLAISVLACIGTCRRLVTIVKKARQQPMSIPA